MTTETPKTFPDRGHLPDLLNDNKLMLARITDLEGDLRECVELLKMARHRIYDELGPVKNGYIQKVDSLLARLQESKTL